MAKCILLSRVSTDKQDLDQQTSELLKAAHSQNYSDNDIIIIEDKESGINLSFLEREGINKLIDTINREQVERVICYEISRIARRADVFYKVRDILIEKKIQLQVLTPGFCLLNDDYTINENSNLLIGIFLSMAESEMRIKKARFKRGKIKRAEEGKYNGGKVVYGYQINKEGYYVIEPEAAETVRKIFRLYTENHKTAWYIAKDMMETGELTQYKFTSARQFVFYILHNPIYGTGSNEGTHYYKHHKQEQKFIIKAPKIISEETWKKACELNQVETPYNKPRVRENIYFAHGIITDSEGHSLGPVNSKGYYATNKMDLENNPGLKNTCISINMVDSLLLHILKGILEANSEIDTKKAIKILREKQTDCLNKINKARKDIEGLKQEIDRIEQRLIAGRLDEDKANEWEEERYDKMLDLEVKISSWEEEAISLDDEMYKIVHNDMIYNVDSMTEIEQKEYIHKYIKKVTVTKLSTYTFELNVDGTIYQMNTNGSCRWIKNASGEEIDYVYLNRYKRKNQ